MADNRVLRIGWFPGRAVTSKKTLYGETSQAEISLLINRVRLELTRAKSRGVQNRRGSPEQISAEKKELIDLWDQVNELETIRALRDGLENYIAELKSTNKFPSRRQKVDENIRQAIQVSKSIIVPDEIADWNGYISNLRGQKIEGFFDESRIKKFD